MTRTTRRSNSSHSRRHPLSPHRSWTWRSRSGSFVDPSLARSPSLPSSSSWRASWSLSQQPLRCFSASPWRSSPSGSCFCSSQTPLRPRRPSCALLICSWRCHPPTPSPMPSPQHRPSSLSRSGRPCPGPARPQEKDSTRRLEELRGSQALPPRVQASRPCHLQVKSLPSESRPLQPRPRRKQELWWSAPPASLSSPGWRPHLLKGFRPWP
mmetsp:Transcript_494/g.1111  ORF Transcript_494/g.1111 Transcript_494/m.1111 type:complete len:211 (-) Transcript_494:257-889(-)